MPAWRAASPRELPSSTRARAGIRREAAASRQRFASRRRSPALSSRRVTATVIVPSRDRTSPAERTGCDRERLRPCGRVRNRGRWYYATLREWERGVREPDGPSKLLLAAIAEGPELVARVAERQMFG